MLHTYIVPGRQNVIQLVINIKLKKNTNLYYMYTLKK